MVGHVLKFYVCLGSHPLCTLQHVLRVEYIYTCVSIKPIIYLSNRPTLHAENSCVVGEALTLRLTGHGWGTDVYTSIQAASLSFLSKKKIEISPARSSPKGVLSEIMVLVRVSVGSLIR